MSNRNRPFGFMINSPATRIANIRDTAAPAQSMAPTYDPLNGPRRFTPSDLTFGPDLQTLEELRGELERKFR
ncbi:hypothetical protein H8M10_11790 [Stenotrophomonas maltophilia]|uniref:hypothetical protein n=1 Tax=Stenotrophomonas maltophilia TaxID=40324 RepID=UPI000D4D6201|nr:hypothetical protein [Stenotrophomonas maltophilia]EKU9980743.1 hypothetical protein [Stenotrophomonas maltophilia]EKX6272460.1 hypothetical protein [Stenotrophomonas maltophilia]MBH1720251.1 hypothetical protein [Stenotrophomonas maltophilia]MBH1794273.1 hypothetical protein [Stenotrophomonas maltophilia]MBK1557700.1 hypothetical protein [Stenotrophomonas maltophilia]